MSTNQNRNQKNNFFMNLALKQAMINLGNTGNNPSVGCIITKNNSVISAGHTSQKGRPHAESNAIDSCKKNINNSNLFVTLEPCSNYGKTPPCVKKIVKNNIKKVYFSINDPDIKSFKKSLKEFKKSNVKVSTGICSKKIKEFYKSYILSRENTLPYVTCKLAISKDFFTINKKRKWITNKYSRGRVHLMRSKHDAIITSSRTIKTDNPSLNCRINGLEKTSPYRIILDNFLKISMHSKVLRDKSKNKTIIFYNKDNINKIKMLKKMGIKLYKVSINSKNDIDLKKALKKLSSLGFSRIFLESGLKLTTNFLNENLVNDLKIFISNNKLKKNGDGNLKKYISKHLKKKRYIIEKVNLFGEKLITYKIK